MANEAVAEAPATEAEAPEAMPAVITEAWLEQAKAKINGAEPEPELDAQADPVPEQAAAEPAPEPEPEKQRPLTDKDWITFRKGKDALRNDRLAVKKQTADLDARESEWAKKRDAEQAALDDGRFDDFFKARFNKTFNEFTSDFANGQMGMTPEMRQAKADAASAKAEVEAMRKESSDLKMEQGRVAACGNIASAFKADKFGAEAKAMADDGEFVAYIQRAASKQIDPSEPAEEQQAVFSNLVRQTIGRARAQYERMHKVFGNQEQATDAGPDGAKYLGSDQSSESSVQRSEAAPKPKRSKTRTIRNQAATTPKPGVSSNEFATLDEFLKHKKLR